MVQGIEIVALLILIAVLLFFGPKKIPDLARGIGQAWGEFRKAKKEIQEELKP